MEKNHLNKGINISPLGGGNRTDSSEEQNIIEGHVSSKCSGHKLRHKYQGQMTLWATNKKAVTKLSGKNPKRTS